MALVSWTSAGEMLLWLRFRGHRLEKCCCGLGFVDVEFENVAVAKVSWVSVFNMWLWLRFWACQNPQERFGITLVQRDVLQDSYRYRARGPGEGRERLLSISFHLQYTVDRLTGGDG